MKNRSELVVSAVVARATGAGERVDQHFKLTMTGSNILRPDGLHLVQIVVEGLSLDELQRLNGVPLKYRAAA